MLNRWILSLLFVVMGSFLTLSMAQAGYGAKVCKQKAFRCVKVKKGDTWKKLFPNSRERDLVRRLNRVNTRLRKGQVIAVPKSLATADLMSISPFPRYIKPSKTNTIIVNQKKLAWGAYDSSGKLLKWGPSSAGKNYCKDIGKRCRTPLGDFHAIRKMGSDCTSTVFPVGKGGAPMQYCIFFKGGIALHGSSEVPGYNASHGCVRMYPEDARWLNTQFVEVVLDRTRVLVDNKLPKGIPESQYKINNVKDVFPWH